MTRVTVHSPSLGSFQLQSVKQDELQVTMYLIDEPFTTHEL